MTDTQNRQIASHQAHQHQTQFCHQLPRAHLQGFVSHPDELKITRLEIHVLLQKRFGNISQHYSGKITTLTRHNNV